ncbi:eukaryotic aspartyl protease family protein [Medicago truncatula]|uniref:Aspartic proteinase Asp1 n=1 Tax=Medicago truncatula TaxID=3880 RepID=G7JDE9_MEDTR|nr:eukaryotic aspartyl protease family protein [Medicago truncatula]
MDVKNRGFSLIAFSLFLLLSSIFPHHFSAANKNNSIPPTSIHSLISSLVYTIKGNVYPDGLYTVSINIGNPPKPYELDIDTGSDLTWVQCDGPDAPCKGCTMPKDKLYKPNGKQVVKCSDPICVATQSTHVLGQICSKQSPPCVYNVQYADHASTLGVLVRDYMHIGSPSSSTKDPLVAFGCGYEQKFSGPTPPHSKPAGILGLGNGKTSILSQLTSIGFIHNVLGHCLSAEGGGYLFLGDKFVPSSGIVWTPIIQSSLEKHYNTGPVDLFFNGKPTPAKGLQIIFDSGSSYTYFSSPVYTIVANMVNNDLKGKPLSRVKDPSLPICWKGVKPFKSLNEVNNYFKPLTLSFTKSKNLQFQLPPVAYLIITKYGNVCLGILNGNEAGLGNRNVVGDISLQDKVVVYDNEKQQIGWASANCKQIPRS